jgi:hypothetical protein
MISQFQQEMLADAKQWSQKFSEKMPFFGQKSQKCHFSNLCLQPPLNNGHLSTMANFNIDSNKDQPLNNCHS